MIPKSTIGAAAVFAVFMLAPANLHGQPPADAQQHEEHHQATPAEKAPSTADTQASMMAMMAKMKANDAKIDGLVAKMHQATGTARTDAMAELLSTLVQERHTMCEPMMQHMMGMMNMMGGSDHGGMNMPAEPKK